MNFSYFFIGLTILLFLILWRRHSNSVKIASSSGDVSQPSRTDAAFLKFQKSWLIIYLIVMGSDWLQGPYVYRLYQSYHFSQAEIGQLFVAGFLSSAIFGTIVGGLADKYGRKRMCVVFGICYSLSCLTKLNRSYYVLMVGRILSGIATSLLFSSFESWMITEHKKRLFNDNLLDDTFSKATLGNGLIAIIAGILSQIAVDLTGPIAPFMLSLTLLLLASLLISTLWPENHGDSKIAIIATFQNAWNCIANDGAIFLLGVVQSFFEAAMYVFVFFWTPTIQRSVGGDGGFPVGLVFASFMVAVMIGSSIFDFLKSETIGWSKESIAVALCSVSCLALATPIFFVNNTIIVFTSFLIFEICCGIYWPCLGSLRGKYIQEDTRAAVMNFFRLPLNLFVVITLLLNLSQESAFFLCSLLLASAAYASWTIMKKGNIQN